MNVKFVEDIAEGKEVNDEEDENQDKAWGQSCGDGEGMDLKDLSLVN